MAILVAPLLGACVYKMDIQQGNYVTQEMAVQLKMGMSKEQVRQALGTPLLTDVFHNERWDYIYYREDEQGKREQRRFRRILRRRQARAPRWRHRPAEETPKETQEAPGDAPRRPEIEGRVTGAGGRMGRTLIEAIGARRRPDTVRRARGCKPRSARRSRGRASAPTSTPPCPPAT
jgi:outer membrane protein assembly factor BamE (lipoprotein component of BamABCDE complex)